MTFDPGTWWLVVGLLGLGGTALAFLLKRNMTESDRTKAVSYTHLTYLQKRICACTAGHH